jgi:hypothetical protein
MRKIIFFCIVILLASVAIWGIKKITRPHQNAAAEESIANLAAVDLFNEFNSSENIANQKWVGKVITVHGIISSVNEAGNYISVNLAASAEGGVNCSVLKGDLSTGNRLNKGDSVTIKGKCTGFLMDVNLVDCIIIK